MSNLPPDGTQHTPTSPYQAPPLPIQPHRPPHDKGVPRWVLLTIVIVIVAASAIGLLVFLGWQLGPLAFAVGLGAAILPVPVIIACFLWLDRYEPEPPLLLALALLWGAFPAAGLALFVNSIASGWLDLITLPDPVVATVVAPIIEEFGKALFPLAILWFMRRQISGITDGIVYAGMSGVGFAMVENILYLGGHGFYSGYEQYGPATGAQMVFGIFIGRIFMSGFAHPLFTALTGIGIGIAARSASKWVRICAPIAGLLLAMILHGSWNLMAIMSATVSMYFFLYGYLGVMVPVFLAMVGVALWVRASEGKLASQILPVYAAAGWITPPEVAALGTLGRRHAARVWANRVAGKAGVAAMRRFQVAATKLALLRDGMDRGLDSAPAHLAQAADDERAQLAAMTEARLVFVGRDPQAPRALWDGQNYHLSFPDGVVRTVPAPAEPVVPLPVNMAPPPPPPPYYGYGLPPGYPAQQYPPQYPQAPR